MHVYVHIYIGEVCFKIEKGDFRYGIEHETYSAQNIDRQTGREEKIHIRHQLIATGKRIRNVREGNRGHYW